MCGACLNSVEHALEVGGQVNLVVNLISVKHGGQPAVNITAVEWGAESSVEYAVEPVDEISWCWAGRWIGWWSCCWSWCWTGWYCYCLMCNWTGCWARGWTCWLNWTGCCTWRWTCCWTGRSSCRWPFAWISAFVRSHVLYKLFQNNHFWWAD